MKEKLYCIEIKTVSSIKDNIHGMNRLATEWGKIF